MSRIVSPNPLIIIVTLNEVTGEVLMKPNRDVAGLLIIQTLAGVIMQLSQMGLAQEMVAVTKAAKVVKDGATT